MKSMKQRDNGFIPVLINTSIGVILWLMTAAIISWFISTDKLNEPIALKIAPLVQGAIVYIIATISYSIGGVKKMSTPAITALAFLAAQLIITLLFWGINGYGLLRGGVVVVVGVVLSLLTNKVKPRSKNIKSIVKRSC